MSWVIVFCSFLGAFCLIVGLLIGATVGRRQLARELRDEQAEQRGEAWVRQLRAAEPVLYERRRPRDAREDPELISKILSQPFEAHADQALALVRDDLTDSAYTADMAARMDRFLEGLCGVPYSADELWSGQ